MTDILDDLSPVTLTWSIDANFVEFHKQMGCLPGAEVHDNPDLMWFTTPISMGGFNGVVRATLRPDDVEQKLVEVGSRFQELNRRWSWAIGTTTLPADLGERLSDLNMKLGGSEIGMAADLHALNETVNTPATFEVMRVRNAATLEQYMHAMVTGFGPPTHFSQAWGEVFTCLGVEEDKPMQHYLGLLDGKPVGTSSVFYGAGVAGVYFVATVPEARNKGIGSAMALAPLLDARELGYRVGILQATEMGSSIYRRLGFGSYGTFAFYVPA